MCLQSYNGGNKQPSEQAATAQLMKSIRQTIFESPTGDIDGKMPFLFLPSFHLADLSVALDQTSKVLQLMPGNTVASASWLARPFIFHLLSRILCRLRASTGVHEHQWNCLQL